MTAGLSIAHPSLHADSDFWNDPYSFYDKLRSIDPVYKGTVLKYPGWYVTGYKEAAAILKDTRFKNRIPLPEASTKYQNLSHIQQIGSPSVSVKVLASIVKKNVSSDG